MVLHRREAGWAAGFGSGCRHEGMRWILRRPDEIGSGAPMALGAGRPGIGLFGGWFDGRRGLKEWRLFGIVDWAAPRCLRRFWGAGGGAGGAVSGLLASLGPGAHPLGIVFVAFVLVACLGVRVQEGGELFLRRHGGYCNYGQGWSRLVKVAQDWSRLPKIGQDK